MRHSDLLGNGVIEGATLVAVCDPNLTKAKQIGDQFNVPYYASLTELVQNVEVDVVSVLTESGNHAKNCIEVATLKKHVVVEKPMALRLSDADAMIKACDTAGVRLFVVKQNRFNVPVVKAREALENGRLGKLIMGTVRVRWCRPQDYYDQDSWRGTWEFDGGVLTNQASHHIDLLEWMLGDVETVYALSSNALADIEAEDTAVVALKFKSGALGTIEATTATRPNDLEGSLSILGEGGSIEIGGFAVNQLKTWRFTNRVPEDERVQREFSVNPPNVYGFGHQAYYEHVVESIVSGSPHLVDGLEGRKSLELISAIYESIETQKPVQLRFEPVRCKLGRK